MRLAMGPVPNALELACHVFSWPSETEGSSQIAVWRRMHMELMAGAAGFLRPKKYLEPGSLPPLPCVFIAVRKRHCHHVFLGRSESDGWHPSNPSRQQWRLAPQTLLGSRGDWSQPDGTPSHCQDLHLAS